MSRRVLVAVLAVSMVLLTGCQDQPADPNGPRVEVSTDSPDPTRVPGGQS